MIWHVTGRKSRDAEDVRKNIDELPGLPVGL